MKTMKQIAQENNFEVVEIIRAGVYTTYLLQKGNLHLTIKRKKEFGDTRFYILSNQDIKVAGSIKAVQTRFGDYVISENGISYAKLSQDDVEEILNLNK